MEKTKFELALEQYKAGTLKAPTTIVNNTEMDYFAFQLISHHFYAKLFAKGITARQMNLKQMKDYYGLKSKSAKDCLIEFESIKDKYLESLKQSLPKDASVKVSVSN
jgi:hypothetical protein